MMDYGFHSDRDLLNRVVSQSHTCTAPAYIGLILVRYCGYDYLVIQMQHGLSVGSKRKVTSFPRMVLENQD